MLATGEAGNGAETEVMPSRRVGIFHHSLGGARCPPCTAFRNDEGNLRCDRERIRYKRVCIRYDEASLRYDESPFRYDYARVRYD